MRRLKQNGVSTALAPLAHEILELCYFGALKSSNHGVSEFWNPGILEPWNPEILEYLHFGILKSFVWGLALGSFIQEFVHEVCDYSIH